MSDAIEVEIGTLNDDWATAGTDVTEVLEQHASLLAIQEGKRARYRDLLSYAKYGVLQNTTTDALAGSVIVWEHGLHLRAGHRGFTFGVRAPGLLARYTAEVRFKPQNVHPFAFLSDHWPPFRSRSYWSPMNLAVVARVRYLRARGYLVMIGCDSNQHRHPAALAGLRWHSARPGSIDGFWLSPEIEVLEIHELPRGSSDHHPVIARVRIPGSRK